MLYDVSAGVMCLDIRYGLACPNPLRLPPPCCLAACSALPYAAEIAKVRAPHCDVCDGTTMPY